MRVVGANRQSGAQAAGSYASARWVPSRRGRPREATRAGYKSHPHIKPRVVGSRGEDHPVQAGRRPSPCSPAVAVPVAVARVPGVGVPKETRSSAREEQNHLGGHVGEKFRGRLGATRCPRSRYLRLDYLSSQVVRSIVGGAFRSSPTRHRSLSRKMGMSAPSKNSAKSPNAR